MNFIHRPYSDLSWLTGFDRILNAGRFRGTTEATPEEAIHETADRWIIRLDLPGFGKESITLKVEDQILHLTAKTPSENPFAGDFERKWKLGSHINAAGISAAFDHGVLEIALPKAEASEPRDISIL